MSREGGVSGGYMNAYDAQPATPSIAQAYVTGLRTRIQECSDELQQVSQAALRVGLMAGNGPATQHFQAAAESLNAAQHWATSVATRLDLAEQNIAALRIVVAEAQSGAASGTAGASRRVRALLHENKAEATRVEVTTIGDNLSNTDTARHYRTRAETLESAFSGPETVHAVLFVLTRDIQEAERAIENTSSSGADLLHRDALSRLVRIANEIKGILGNLDV